MTVDIARITDNGGALAVHALAGANDALASLARWVEAAQHAVKLVTPLVDTPFVPEAYRPKVDPRATPEQKEAAHRIAVANATGAVLQGITLGIEPLMALQQIYIVHGRPGMYAKMMVALVQSHGHEVWTEDESDTRVVVAGRRKGSQNIERVTVTMDQARKAGWTSNQAYAKTPRDMLWARAASRVCDRIASDAIKGIASVEEIQDTIKAEAETGNGTRTVRAPARKAAAAAIDASVAEEEPPLDEAQAPVQPAVEAEPARPITAAQSKKLHTMLGASGRSDRDIGLVYIAGVIGREIASTKELSLDEARVVIDALEVEEQQQPDDEPTLDVDGVE